MTIAPARRRMRQLDRQLTRGSRTSFYDPTGARHGIPTYPWRLAPEGLATRRQLRALGLRPGGQDPCAQVLWRRGARVAYLYRVDLAKPRRTPSIFQLIAVDLALLARRTCGTCGEVRDYYISRRLGECNTCHHRGGTR